MSELFSLENKSVVITGSSRGIGEAIAKRFAEIGAKVVVSSRNIESCQKVADFIQASGGQAVAFKCNISKKNECNNLIDFAIEKYKKIDVLVCNAASNPYYGKLTEISDELFDKIMNNNVKSNLWLCQKALPEISKVGGGSVIIISSIAGLQGVKNLGAYSVSKTADIGLIRSLAVEWGEKNININGICPGIIKTDFAKALWNNPNILQEVEALAPLKRIGTSDEVAGSSILLASKAGAFITGQIIVIDGGVTIAGHG